MTEVEKFIKKLHRLEKSGDLEVEHLLKSAKDTGPGSHRASARDV